MDRRQVSLTPTLCKPHQRRQGVSLIVDPNFSAHEKKIFFVSLYTEKNSDQALTHLMVKPGGKARKVKKERGQERKVKKERGQEEGQPKAKADSKPVDRYAPFWCFSTKKGGCAAKRRGKAHGCGLQARTAARRECLKSSVMKQIQQVQSSKDLVQVLDTAKAYITKNIAKNEPMWLMGDRAGGAGWSPQEKVKKEPLRCWKQKQETCTGECTWNADTKKCRGPPRVPNPNAKPRKPRPKKVADVPNHGCRRLKSAETCGQRALCSWDPNSEKCNEPTKQEYDDWQYKFWNLEE